MSLSDEFEIYNISDAAKKAGVTRATYSRWIDDGEVRAFRFEGGKQDKIFIPSPLVMPLKKGDKRSVISFSNIKGGVGKTTISTNCAYFLSFLGAKVLFIDFDAQANASSLFFTGQEPTSPTLVDIFQPLLIGDQISPKTVDQSIINIKYPHTNFDVIPSHLKLSKIIEKLSGEPGGYKALSKLVDIVKDRYDFIIIDTPPNPGMSLYMSISAADDIVIVTDAEGFAVSGLETLIEEVEFARREYNVVKNIDAIMINKVKNLQIHTLFMKTIFEIGERYSVNKTYQIPDLTIPKESQLLGMMLGEIRGELASGMRSSRAILEYAIDKFTANNLPS